MKMLVLGMAIQVLGGVAAVAASRMPRLTSVLGAGCAILGASLALYPAACVLVHGERAAYGLPWDAAHGRFSIELDPLSAMFLVPVACLAIACAVYGANYLLAYCERKSLGPPWFFFNACVAGMSLLLVARTVFLFVLAWEIMSLAAYFLVTFEHELPPVRRAGWVYLIATHLGVSFVLAAYLLLGSQAASLDYADLNVGSKLGATASGLVFVLAVIGFGTKAGFVPFHIWLPEAHPAAPSHVSALMSGVVIKMGLYGLLRMLTFLGPPAAWWGPMLAGLGMLTALIGISLATHQRDIKRALAYSSIENIGLIGLSLGLGLWGQATGRPIVAALGYAGALLHVWNHALMKGLMFLAAGSLLHATGTRDIERMGGLMHRMPWTGCLMIGGAVAIAALPPLNGFTGKWLMYLALLHGGLSRGGDQGLTALLSVGLLALVGTLAVVAFVRMSGITLLGSARSDEAAHAHESSPWMLVPMICLAGLCLGMALLPTRAVVLLFHVLVQVNGSGDLIASQAVRVPWESLLPLGTIDVCVLGAVALAFAAYWLWTQQPATATGPTWGCGYARPTPRMQYTGRSFAEMLVSQLLVRSFRPTSRRKVPQGLFPAPGEYESQNSDPFTDKVFEPFFARWAARFAQLRILQQGYLHLYLMYILLTLVLALAWISLRPWWRPV